MAARRGLRSRAVEVLRLQENAPEPEDDTPSVMRVQGCWSVARRLPFTDGAHKKRAKQKGASPRSG
jgi:hypothetical protein